VSTNRDTRTWRDASRALPIGSGRSGGRRKPSPNVRISRRCMVVLRKNISVEKGDQRLFDEIRHVFSLMNDRTTPPADIVLLANDRCNQET